MNFDELDKKMRIYEQSLDQVLLPEIYLVARLDGRGFTRLTKEICKFEAPFDIRFRDMMVHTVQSLMDCGFRVVYGFTESDEISLLFAPGENTFGRKVRKYNSTLAGEGKCYFFYSTWKEWLHLIAELFRCLQWSAYRTIFYGVKRMRTEMH